MSGIEGKLAIEAIKPAAGFINALLGPKIEKLKLWANEKELKGKLDSDNLSNVMERYLKKLSCRVSEITTLSFSSLKMNIFEAYEPLSIGKIGQFGLPNNENVDFSTLVKGEVKSCSIIDSAGMGKSTFSKFIVATLLFKSDRIPILFELRKINKDISLVDNLAKEFDFPGKVFDRDLFYKLLELGKFYVVIDGFDEVPLEYQEILSSQIQELSLKGGNNILMLTSRPQDILPDIVNGITLRFLPFTVEQAKNLLRRYDSISNLDVGKRLIDEIDSVPAKFIESPLLVSLLYRTFGVNHSIADRICTFYDEIYHALYKGHDLINKNGYGREKKSKIDFEDFRKLLRAMCYYMMLNRKTSFVSWSEATKFIDRAASISSIKPTSSSNFLDDLLVSVPLMQKDGNEYRFFHKTLLEFFAAEYIVFDKSSSLLLKKLFDSKIVSTFDKVFEFIAEINPSLFDSVVTYPFALLVSKSNYGKSLFEQALYTFIFRQKCKIGLWKVKDYKDEDQGELPALKYTVFEHLVKDGFTILNSTIIKLEGVDYFLTISFTDKPNNLHFKAWSQITKSIVYDDSWGLVSSQPMRKLADVLGFNKWNDLDGNIISNIKQFSMLLKLFVGGLGLNLYFNNESFRILSEEKVNNILLKVNRENEFIEEMDDFL